MKNYFTKGEIALFCASAACILLAFACFGAGSALTPVASLIGVAALLLNAKGNPLGQALMVLFSVLYGLLSYAQAYYGEMLTYLGMTAPMAVMALVAWLRHPYAGNRAQVAVRETPPREVLLIALLTVPVTAAFYFVLRALGTAQLALSTLSVATSFAAVALTFRRSAWFAAAYAANDAVLIALWAPVARDDPSSLGVVICFAVFFMGDLYGFVCWRKMRRAQAEGARA